jgi:hypothetical protein
VAESASTNIPMPFISIGQDLLGIMAFETYNVTTLKSHIERMEIQHRQEVEHLKNIINEQKIVIHHMRMMLAKKQPTKRWWSL